MEQDCVSPLFFFLSHLAFCFFLLIQEQKFTMQVSELEGQFHQKAKEIGMVQTELKTIKQFQKRKIQVEKELDDVSFFHSFFKKKTLKKKKKTLELTIYVCKGLHRH